MRTERESPPAATLGACVYRALVPAAWSPTERYLDRSRLRRFANAQGLSGYDALLTWATDDLERFWRAVDRDLGLVWTAPYSRAMDGSKGLPWSTWWTGGRMNYVGTALRADREQGRLALVAAERLGRPYPRRERDVTWGEVMRRGGTPLVNWEDTSAEDPFMIIYTSGTTGRPKGAVHVHGGFPVKAAQDMAHCFDVQDGDLMWWFTDLGWMMGPWLIAGGLILGASILLYDGAPDFPDAGRVWSIVERHGVTHLGMSPTAIRGLMRAGEEPVRTHDRSSLFVLGSTGEPWNPEPWWWYFGVVGERRAPFVNYSGGTEISGGIVGCTTWMPLKPTSFSGPVPGIAVDVVDERGDSVRGEVGELVVRQPWPGMTRGFWRAPDHYLASYWRRFPDVWVHGDWARIDADGFWYIDGRSDDTLKVAGKRVGPAEVESAATAHPAVPEAAAIGVPHEIKGEAVIVFAVLRPGCEASDALEREIADRVMELLGRPLRPDAVRFVAELPKTRNAKVLRRVIRGAYLGKADLGDLSALENLAAVELIRELVAAKAS